MGFANYFKAVILAGITFYGAWFGLGMAFPLLGINSSIYPVIVAAIMAIIVLWRFLKKKGDW